jgi:hypothetical protein
MLELLQLPLVERIEAVYGMPVEVGG